MKTITDFAIFAKSVGWEYREISLENGGFQLSIFVDSSQTLIVEFDEYGFYVKRS